MLVAVWGVVTLDGIRSLRNLYDAKVIPSFCLRLGDVWFFCQVLFVVKSKCFLYSFGTYLFNVL